MNRTVCVAVATVLCVHMCRVQSEVDEVLGSKTFVTTEDLDKLNYIEQVLNYMYTISKHEDLSHSSSTLVEYSSAILNGRYLKRRSGSMVQLLLWSRRLLLMA